MSVYYLKIWQQFLALQEWHSTILPSLKISQLLDGLLDFHPLSSKL